MELIYRGTRYNATPAYVEMADAPVTGTYRGATVVFHRAATLTPIQQVMHLIYRGVAFDQAIATPAV